MNIGTCTSCQTGSDYAQAMREREQMYRQSDVITEPWLSPERFEVKSDFQPDPSRLLDILA